MKSFFNQSTVLSSRAADGHQMYSGGSVLGKVSIGIEVSPTSKLTLNMKHQKIMVNDVECRRHDLRNYLVVLHYYTTIRHCHESYFNIIQICGKVIQSHRCML